jgi:hypothetical protein
LVLYLGGGQPETRGARSRGSRLILPETPSPDGDAVKRQAAWSLLREQVSRM